MRPGWPLSKLELIPQETMEISGNFVIVPRREVTEPEPTVSVESKAEAGKCVPTTDSGTIRRVQSFFFCSNPFTFPSQKRREGRIFLPLDKSDFAMWEVG